MNTEILPAILPKDFAELEEKISMVKGFASIVHIDICDGIFTPTKTATWPYRKHDENFEAILREEAGLPHWEEVNFEVHMMVKNPENTIQQWVTAGATRIIIHAEATEKLEEIISEYAGVVEIGLALELDTPIEAVEVYLDRVDFIQLMAIEQLGNQGQGFNEEIYEKISTLKHLHRGGILSIDGGITFENVGRLLDAGVNRLVIGSAIFGQENYVEALNHFTSLTLNGISN